MKDISFVIPSYRSRDTIMTTLDSIRNQDASLSMEILVVDSSGDDTEAWIKEHYPEVEVISSPSRLFPGAARNLGAKRSRGDYLAFVDADAFPEPGWLETLYSKLTSTPPIEMLGGAIAEAGSGSLAARVLHWIEFSEFLPGLRSDFRPALSSSNLLIRRKEFLPSGGFNPRFAMAEDLVFCQKLTGKIYFESSTRVLHQHRSDWLAVLGHLRELGYWSGLCRRTHAAESTWLRTVPLLSFGLPLLRSARIISRVFHSDLKQGLVALIYLPFLLLGLSLWTVGFYRGDQEDLMNSGVRVFVFSCVRVSNIRGPSFRSVVSCQWSVAGGSLVRSCGIWIAGVTLSPRLSFCACSWVSPNSPLAPGLR